VSAWLPVGTVAAGRVLLACKPASCTSITEHAMLLSHQTVCLILFSLLAIAVADWLGYKTAE